MNAAFFNVNAVISLGLFAVGSLDLWWAVGDTEVGAVGRPGSLSRSSVAASRILLRHAPNFVSPILKPIRDKVEAGERLSLDDGLVLERPDVPLHELGELANLVRERKNGNVAYYNINTHLNPTNVCVYRCTFCAFRSDLRDPKGYVMSDEQILARGARGRRQRLHRDAHRRRAAPPDEVRLVPQRHPHPARRLSRAAPQGLDRRSRSTGSAGWPRRPSARCSRR